ncbi:MAG: RNA polymerase sigma factor region1.1 domain-containing protein [Nitrospirota bacterium]|nr:RNA polymerase sigma factor region1.1 domain-containing protein [Nitrospirota bacterium]
MRSTTAVESLMETGRQRGGLEIDDIRRALPVDAMSIEELADVLARLEEAGISVEIDPALLTGRHRKMTLRGAKPATEPPQHSERMTVDHGRLAILASSIKAARDNSSRAPGPAQPYVKRSGTIFVIAAVLILALLTIVVWRFV